MRRRGPHPTLRDSEVLTMKAVGEFLGLDQEKAVFSYFRRHYGHFFPALGRVHRTTFTRQAANLRQMKARLWGDFCAAFNSTMGSRSLTASPCRSAASPARRDAGACASCRPTALTRWRSRPASASGRTRGSAGRALVTAFEVAPAHVHELRAAGDLLEGVTGDALGDRNYLSPALAGRLRAGGLRLLTPYRQVTRERKAWPRRLVNTRRRIETVIGQLVGRFHARQVWARDPRHFFSRLLRKVLGHTLFVGLCQRQELLPLRVAELLTC